MKKICVKEIESIELAFKDKSLYIKFNMTTFANMLELEQDTAWMNGAGISKPELCARILHCSAVDEEGNKITLEEARCLVSNMDIGTVLGIVNEFAESVNTSMENIDPNQVNEMKKKITQQYVKPRQHQKKTVYNKSQSRGKK